MVTSSFSKKEMPFFKQNTIKDILRFLSKVGSTRIPIDEQILIQEKQYLCCCRRAKNPDFAYFSFIKGDYPQDLGFRSLYEMEKVVGELYKKGEIDLNAQKDLNLKIPEIDLLLEKYNDQKQRDLLAHAFQQTNQLKTIIQKNLDQLMED